MSGTMRHGRHSCGVGKGECLLPLTKERRKTSRAGQSRQTTPTAAALPGQAQPSPPVSWHSASSELFPLIGGGNKEGIFESKKCVMNFNFCVTSWAYILKLMMQIPFLKSELS